MKISWERKSKWCRWLGWVVPTGALLLLAVGAESPRREDHERAFDQTSVLVREDSQLKQTTVSPSWEAAPGAGRNVLWCGTFQLAWNEACSLLREDIAFDTSDPVVAALNRKEFTKKSLDQDSYVALAGFVRDDIFGSIRAELARKFGGRAMPRFIPSRSSAPRPQDLVAYAYLFKNLEFHSPFEKLPRMQFGRNKVLCFGFEGGKKEVGPLCAQVLIHDYRDPDDFVIELKTKSREDRVILAKVPPSGSLGATIAAVRARAAGAHVDYAGRDDTLMVPKLNFDITRRYREMEGRPLVLRHASAPRDLQLVQALQNIRFQMDEKGVVLRSEAHAVGGCSMRHMPQPQHIMIFDKPYLILLEREKASAPYFALWVENAELLAR